MQSAPSQKGYAEHWNQRRWKNIRTLSETQSKTKVTRTRVTQGIRCHCGINNRDYYSDFLLKRFTKWHQKKVTVKIMWSYV